jgi:hypothetical protein
MIRWRQGRQQPKNIYLMTTKHPEGILAGQFQRESWCRRAVKALNALEEKIEGDAAAYLRKCCGKDNK